MKLICDPLENDFVRLEPLAETHREGLRAAASDPAIWRHWPRDIVGDGWDETFDRQLGEHAAGSWMIFTATDRLDRRPLAGEQTHSAPRTDLQDSLRRPGAGGPRIVGQTCYLAIEPKHGRVEVGGTWYDPAFQATHINPAAKLLMLGHAFACGAERVELKTDAENARSRAAMLKMGARFEGIFRHHMRRLNGTWRDTAWYCVLREEWPGVKASLEARLA